MERIILFVDDAAHARQVLSQQSSPGAAPGARHWIVIGCAPRMTHRISKWVSHSARENWRAKWFGKLKDELLPLLQQGGDEVTTRLARGPLLDLARDLTLEFGTARVVDARRPKVGADLEPVVPGMKPPHAPGWALPSALIGLGTLLALTWDLAD